MAWVRHMFSSNCARVRIVPPADIGEGVDPLGHSRVGGRPSAWFGRDTRDSLDDGIARHGQGEMSDMGLRVHAVCERCVSI